MSVRVVVVGRQRLYWVSNSNTDQKKRKTKLEPKGLTLPNQQQQRRLPLEEMFSHIEIKTNLWVFAEEPCRRDTTRQWQKPRKGGRLLLYAKRCSLAFVSLPLSPSLCFCISAFVSFSMPLSRRWTRLNDAERRWTTLNDLGRSWTTLNDLGRRWTTLNDLGRRWTT